MSASLPRSFLSELERALGPDGLTREPSELARYGTDWTRVFAPRPSLVVFPRSTADVSTVLRLCSSHGVPVVPSGGRTGLAAGAVAANGEVVLSLERMRRMEPVDRAALTVRVEAGAVTEAVHRHAAEHGLFWPIDLAAKGSCQIGGNLATNAGGLRVIRYGAAREWVLGLVAVKMDGSVLDLSGALEKNNTGYDLRQLLIGSEGTLAVITEATLKLTPLPRRADVVFFALEDVGGALALLEDVRQQPFELSAFEMLTDACLAEVERTGKGRSPFAARAPLYLLVEIEPPSEEAVEGWLLDVLERGLVRDGVRSMSKDKAQKLWALRENVTASLATRGLIHKNDVAVPVRALPSFIADLEAMFAHEDAGLELFLFGHVGDGSVHVNVPCPADMAPEEFLARCERADEDLGALLARHKGSISAEHGIGLLKKKGLPASRSSAEIEIFRAIKRAFDPENLLNPGKLVDP